MVNYDDLMNNTEQTLEFISKDIGIIQGDPREFKARSSNPPRWLTDAQRIEVSDILKSHRVLKTP